MSEIHFETDVLIIGGGPAGTSAALSLLNYSSLNVLIADRSDFSSEKVGEHVTSSIFEMLEYLKVPTSELRENAMIPAHGTVSYWGSDQPYFVNSIHNAQGDTFQLDRGLFEMTLLEEVTAKNGTVLPRTKYRSAQFNETTETWTVQLEHAEKGRISVACKFLVDASGRNASIARKIGIPIHRFDQLVGIGQFFNCSEKSVENTQILETTEHGWVYSAVLPDNKIVAVLFTDADIAASCNFRETATFHNALLETKAVGKRISNLTTTQKEPWVRNAHSHYSESSAHSHFIAVGDAAAAYDPMSSMGIGFALTSGAHGARFIRAYLNGQKAAIQQYDKDIASNMKTYWEQRVAIYDRENRWLESPFWARRKEHVTREVIPQ